MDSAADALRATARKAFAAEEAAFDAAILEAAVLDAAVVAGGVPSDGARLAALRRDRWEKSLAAVEATRRRDSISALAKEGAAFYALVSSRASKADRKTLLPLAAALEEAVASRGDCPAEAFAAVRASAAKLGAADLRRWIAALSEGTPAAVAAYVADSKLALAAGTFPEDFQRFRDECQVRSALRAAHPAAAAASWYVDGAVSRSFSSSGDAAYYVPAPQEALEALAGFLRIIAAVDEHLLRSSIAEADDIARALREVLATSWVARTIEGDAFASALGLETATLEVALDAGRRAFFDGPSSGAESAAIDFAAVARAEAFAAALEEAGAPDAVLSAFAAFRGDESAVRAFRAGKRYSAARDRLREAAAQAAAAATGGAAPGSFDPFDLQSFPAEDPAALSAALASLEKSGLEADAIRASWPAEGLPRSEDLDACLKGSLIAPDTDGRTSAAILMKACARFGVPREFAGRGQREIAVLYGSAVRLASLGTVR